jgi:hypothetical protein
MRRGDVAHVRDALVRLLAHEELGRRGHAPARHGELAEAIGSGAHDRSGIIREDVGQRWHVAGDVAQRSRQIDDRLLGRRDAVEIAHRGKLGAGRGARKTRAFSASRTVFLTRLLDVPDAVWHWEGTTNARNENNRHSRSRSHSAFGGEPFSRL